MMLKLFNTLIRQKEVFTPLRQDEVGLYTCGPTVYAPAHLGNLRTYIFEDILKRTLVVNGYQVKHVMNITDVGHLTSDADEGEDKMEKGATTMLYIKCTNCGKETPTYMAATKEAFETMKITDCAVDCRYCGTENIFYKNENNTNIFYGVKNKLTVWQIADTYTQLFKQNLKDLNILMPDIWCKATDEIEAQINLIKKLETSGYTYKTSDGIYFDTSKFKNYGQLARLDIKGLKQGARVEINKEKRNATDFALWKFSPSNTKRQMEWESPWGKGFPGWHIECSAMSIKYLGETFDIHCGGIDHIPVHHTNEIAQSEGATGKTFVKYWLHGEFMVIDEKRMGKSEGNFITLDSLKKKNISPLAYRYFCLNTHYRKPLNFSWEALESAAKALQNLQAKISTLGKPSVGCAEFEQKFIEAIDDDLNTPQALAVLWDLIKSDYPDGAKKQSLLKFDKVLGLDFGNIKPLVVPENVQKLVNEREQARIHKNWQSADSIREQISSLGYLVDDTELGPIVKNK